MNNLTTITCKNYLEYDAIIDIDTGEITKKFERKAIMNTPKFKMKWADDDEVITYEECSFKSLYDFASTAEEIAWEGFEPDTVEIIKHDTVFTVYNGKLFEEMCIFEGMSTDENVGSWW